MTKRSAIVWYLLCLGLVSAFAILNLQMPFLGDQAVAILAAKNIEAGGNLYVDFWDNKMPGLFWFYWLGGKIFGFDELGIHLFEFIWMGAFAVSIAYYLRSYYQHWWLSGVASVTVVGIYYAAAGANQLTLLEIVVTFPLFLCAWFASQTKPTNVVYLQFVSGALAGIVAVFKLVLVSICIGFWLVVAVDLKARRQWSATKILAKVWLPISIGVVLVLGTVVLKFWADGNLQALLWTAFTYPPAALESSPKAPYSRLAISSFFFLSKYAVMVIPILIAIYQWARRDRGQFTAILIAWLVIGLGVICVQRFSWWTYHFFLIFPPAGILAVKGIDEIIIWLSDANEKSKKSGIYCSILLSLVVISPIVTIAHQKIVYSSLSFLFKEESVLEYRFRLRPEYKENYEITRFLFKESALPGRIAVFGDPAIYLAANREPALAMVGWPWEYFLQTQWLKLPDQIIDAAPSYIFIANREDKLMDIRKGGVKELIFSRYVAVNRPPGGTWFQLKRQYQ